MSLNTSIKSKARGAALTAGLFIGASALTGGVANAGICGSSNATTCNWTQTGSVSSTSYSTAATSYSSASMAPPAGMCKVACPVTVDLNPGERVIDCYARCQPKPVIKQYQVVRPIIVRRYPVPIYVPPRTVYLPAPVCTQYIQGPDSRYGYDRAFYRGCR